LGDTAPFDRYRRRVNRLRCSPPATRLLLTALLALCLGVRLLAPAGFMPSFANGSLAIVECPGADGAQAPMAIPGMPNLVKPGMTMPTHDDRGGDDGFHHQACPYASAASLAGLEPGVVAIVLPAVQATLPPRARPLRAFRRRAIRDLPPSQAPPLPA
jgi:hypothetical protein